MISNTRCSPSAESLLPSSSHIWPSSLTHIFWLNIFSHMPRARRYSCASTETFLPVFSACLKFSMSSGLRSGAVSSYSSISSWYWKFSDSNSFTIAEFVEISPVSAFMTVCFISSAYFSWHSLMSSFFYYLLPYSLFNWLNNSRRWLMAISSFSLVLI